jgi:hypothetical protein
MIVPNLYSEANPRNDRIKIEGIGCEYYAPRLLFENITEPLHALFFGNNLNALPPAVIKLPLESESLIVFIACLDPRANLPKLFDEKERKILITRTKFLQLINFMKAYELLYLPRKKFKVVLQLFADTIYDTKDVSMDELIHLFELGTTFLEKDFVVCNFLKHWLHDTKATAEETIRFLRYAEKECKFVLPVIDKTNLYSLILEKNPNVFTQDEILDILKTHRNIVPIALLPSLCESLVYHKVPITMDIIFLIFDPLITPKPVTCIHNIVMLAHTLQSDIASRYIERLMITAIIDATGSTYKCSGKCIAKDAYYKWYKSFQCPSIKEKETS